MSLWNRHHVPRWRRSEEIADAAYSSGKQRRGVGTEGVLRSRGGWGALYSLCLAQGLVSIKSHRTVTPTALLSGVFVPWQQSWAVTETQSILSLDRCHRMLQGSTQRYSCSGLLLLKIWRRVDSFTYLGCLSNIYAPTYPAKGIRMWVMVKRPEQMEIREVTRPPGLSSWSHWEASWVGGAVVCSPVGGFYKPPHGVGARMGWWTWARQTTWSWLS